MKLLALLASISSLLLSACSDPAPPVVKPAEVTAVPAAKPSPQPRVTPKPVAQGKLTGVDIGQLFTMNQTGKAMIIDVRPPLYYNLGHIDGAESMPLVKYDKVITSKRPHLDTALKSGKVIVLYCQNTNCPDAHKTGLKLIKLGYSVSVYRGGWEEWKQAGF